MSANLEITGTFLSEKFRFSNLDGDTIIGEIWVNSDINDTITIKGQADVDELQTDQEYRFYGRWTSYKNKRTGSDERQFHFSSFVRQQPHSREAVIAYLRQAGEGLGFGTVRAAKLWQEFGSDAVRVMREQPEQAIEFLNSQKLKLPLDAAQKISEWLKHEQDLEGCVLDLTDLLVGRGFPKSTARSAVKLWGNKAAQTIRRNPYLMMKRLLGCGFKRCDALYLDLGKPPAALKRQALCGWYAIASNTDGDTWHNIDVSLKGIRSQVGGADVNPERAVTLALRAKWMAQERTDGIRGPISATGNIRWVAEQVKAEHEQQLAIAIGQAMVEPLPEIPSDRLIPLYPGYRATSDGRIQSCWSNGGYQTESWKDLRPEKIKGGYLRVRLRSGPMEYEHAQVSHLVLEAFIGPRPIDAVACHKNADPTDNRIRNLRWDTRSANEDDKKLIGTHQTGSRNPSAKITEADAIEIRRLYSEGEMSTYKLAEAFGISRPVVCKIIKRELWDHV